MAILDRAHKSRALAFLRRLTSRKSTNAQKQRHEKDAQSASPTKQHEARDSGNKENQYDNNTTSFANNTAPSHTGRSYYDDSVEHVTESYRSDGPTETHNHRHASHSDVDGQSKAGTSRTVGQSTASMGGGNSIFSSPNQSSRSLTTTLTTIHSQAPSVLLNNSQPPTSAQGYPPAPVSAIPAYLNNRGGSSHVPATYRSATANNLLSDNASVLTLASSSHRHGRRDSLDEDASIRALPPRSTWGGSRESLPLSVLSQGNEPFPLTSGTLLQPQQRYSTSTFGVGAPVLSSERNSVYAGKTSTVDASSIRSGHVGHGRSDSTTGSVMSSQANTLPVTREQLGDGEVSL
jgi:hypothetical protein